MPTPDTPEALRAEAADLDRRAAESFDRCDTDGFLSQWALNLTARQRRMEADLAEAGGVAEFPALYTTGGEPVPARLVQTRYGTTWAIFATAADAKWGTNAPVIAWQRRSSARTEERRAAYLAERGYVERLILAPARVVMRGEGRGLSGAMSVHPALQRRDGGYDPNAPLADETEPYYDERTCSLCDAVGHGYPGAGPCPLEDRGYDTDGVWR